jgi:hypothetical protein
MIDPVLALPTLIDATIQPYFCCIFLPTTFAGG